MDYEREFEMEDRMEDLLEERLINQRRNNTGPHPNDILESMSVIDKQNLVTWYVMKCYTALYPTSEAFARLPMIPPPRSAALRNAAAITAALTGSRPTTNTKSFWAPGEDRRLSINHHNSIKLEVSATSEWDQSLCEDPLSLVLEFTVSPLGVKVHQTLTSCTTPINDEVEEAQNVIIDEAREREARNRGEVIPIHSDNADVLVDDPPSDASSSMFDIHHLPTKKYTVKSEIINKYQRGLNLKSIHAESLIKFGFRVDSDPTPDPEDISCELSIKVTTFATYNSGYCIITSFSHIDTTQTQGTSVKHIQDQTPPVSFCQPMNREFAELVIDGIANNYTAVVQIIGLALILHFSEF